MPFCTARSILLPYTFIRRHEFAKNESNCRYTQWHYSHFLWVKANRWIWIWSSRGRTQPADFLESIDLNLVFFSFFFSSLNNRLYWTVEMPPSSNKFILFYLRHDCVASPTHSLSLSDAVVQAKWQRQKTKTHSIQSSLQWNYLLFCGEIDSILDNTINCINSHLAFVVAHSCYQFVPMHFLFGCDASWFWLYLIILVFSALFSIVVPLPICLLVFFGCLVPRHHLIA